jgi:DNA-binding MarR family transcriptional regulator
VVRLALTPRGRDLARRYRQVQRQTADAIFDLLTGAQARSLLGLMEILAEGAQPAEEAR